MDLKGWVRGTSNEQHLGAQAASRPVPGIRWWHQILFGRGRAQLRHGQTNAMQPTSVKIKAVPYTVPVYSSTPVLLGATQAPTRRVNINSIGFNIGLSVLVQVRVVGGTPRIYRHGNKTLSSGCSCRLQHCPVEPVAPSHSALFPPPSPPPHPSTTTIPTRPPHRYFLPAQGPPPSPQPNHERHRGPQARVRRCDHRS